jgi:hypothetical protein
MWKAKIINLLEENIFRLVRQENINCTILKLRNVDQRCYKQSERQTTECKKVSVTHITK